MLDNKLINFIKDKTNLVLERNIGNVSLFSRIITIIIIISVLLIFISIFTDFLKYNQKDNTVHKKKSIVSTFSMTLFFILYYFIIRLRIGAIYIKNIYFNYFLIILGVFFIILGTFINIKSRFTLKNNWSDHIKIYSDQSLITNGIFGYVRHPLYSSLFMMFYGGGLVYNNYLGIILTTFIFIPMMNYRAKQEEFYLEKTFNEYSHYKKYVGRFFPKSFTKYQGGKNV